MGSSPYFGAGRSAVAVGILGVGSQEVLGWEGVVAAVLGLAASVLAVVELSNSQYGGP